jgi:AMP deaminase
LFPPSALFRYFAKSTKQVLQCHEKAKGHCSTTDMHLLIYGMESNEWTKLHRWILRNWEGGNMLMFHNRWLVQVPRLWRVYYQKGRGDRLFQDMLKNLFCPLFNATLHPEEHPEVSEFLSNIVGFVSVDIKGALESWLSFCSLLLWRREDNPAFSWQMYHLSANIEVLNRVRESRGLNMFSFMPHAGETVDPMHLAAMYMLDLSINHGINLNKQVLFQYLYYLDQVRVCAYRPLTFALGDQSLK